MDGLRNIYSNSTQFVERYYFPKNTREILLIGLYVAVTFYLTDYFMNYRLFKWIYMGTILILLASWYSSTESSSGNSSGTERSRGNSSGPESKKGMFILGSR